MAAATERPLMRWDFAEAGQGALMFSHSAAEHPLGEPYIPPIIDYLPFWAC